MKSLVRSFFAVAVVATLGTLVGCGGGGTPSGVAITVQVAATPTTIAVGQTSSLTAVVSNDSSNQGVTWSLSGVGTLSNQTSTSATYTAPASVSSTQIVSITATSVASSSSSASIQINVTGTAVSILVNGTTTINQGGTASIAATVTGDSTNSGVNWSLSGPGTLTNNTTTSVTYDAPASVSGAEVATITATSVASSAATALTQIGVVPSGAANNVQFVTVDGGPVAGSIYPNGIFTSATICVPGSATNCTTVDHLLVDTGSVGLRVLGSSLNGLGLSPITSNGMTLNNCVSFVDLSFLWGQVDLADVHIAGETASSIPIHVVADPSGFAIPAACSNGGTDEDNQAGLGANGILGVGPEPFDCGFACDPNGGQQSPPNIYFACSSTGCQSTFVSCGSECSDSSPNQQIVTPVVAFSLDNNGEAINFPSVTDGEPSVTGTMTFGIGTEANNALGLATVYTLNSMDEFTTNYGTQVLTSSFIDSGSNAYFFPDSTIPVCSDASSFFCPSSTDFLNAQNIGATQGSGTVNFSVANADTLFNNSTNAAYGDLAGPNAAGSFDWGLPFFFGKTVFTPLMGSPYIWTTSVSMVGILSM